MFVASVTAGPFRSAGARRSLRGGAFYKHFVPTGREPGYQDLAKKTRSSTFATVKARFAELSQRRNESLNNQCNLRNLRIGISGVLQEALKVGL